MLSVRIELVDQAAVCRIHGEIDAVTARLLCDAMVGVSRFPHVVLDAAGVDFIDSSGIAVLIFGAKKIKAAGGSVAMCAPRRAVERVLRTVGMDLVFPIVPTLRDALDVAEPAFN